MTPQQAVAFLDAQQSDVMRPYALNTPEFYALAGADLAKHVAQAAIATFDRTELVALARTTESPVLPMPPEVEQAITEALSKEPRP